ncbi:hypothetical protein AMEX_G24521 [Astyanax mexicanus]|uniref:Secreted protein n=1 Tax=Astyanax mexicanus TaxID=7994 RepID=A0A8T2KUP6_ASTMX|nr:hypothetical protein AMEX_G24521 [Astyanax mexicanus]
MMMSLQITPPTLIVLLIVNVCVQCVDFCFSAAPPPPYCKTSEASHFLFLAPNDLSLLQLIIPHSAEMNRFTNELK